MMQEIMNQGTMMTLLSNSSTNPSIEPVYTPISWSTSPPINSVSPMSLADSTTVSLSLSSSATNVSTATTVTTLLSSTVTTIPSVTSNYNETISQGNDSFFHHFNCSMSPSPPTTSSSVSSFSSSSASPNLPTTVLSTSTPTSCNQSQCIDTTTTIKPASISPVNSVNSEDKSDSKKRKTGKSNYKHIPHREKPPHLVARRNARERRRVQAVNTAFARLRKCVPVENRNKRLSKVKTLQKAIEYISRLQGMLKEGDTNSNPDNCNSNDYSINSNSSLDCTGSTGSLETTAQDKSNSALIYSEPIYLATQSEMLCESLNKENIVDTKWIYTDNAHHHSNSNFININNNNSNFQNYESNMVSSYYQPFCSNSPYEGYPKITN